MKFFFKSVYHKRSTNNILHFTIILEEDKEQRERLVQLFSPQKKSDFRSTTISVLQLDDDCGIKKFNV